MYVKLTQIHINAMLLRLASNFLLIATTTTIPRVWKPQVQSHSVSESSLREAPPSSVSGESDNRQACYCVTPCLGIELGS